MFGGGGFGIEVIEYFYETYNKLDYKIVGIIDEHKNNINEFKNYNNNDLIHYKSIEDTPIENHKFLISVLDTNTRERVYKSLNSRKAEFINLIHPKASHNCGESRKIFRNLQMFVEMSLTSAVFRRILLDIRNTTLITHCAFDRC